MEVLPDSSTIIALSKTRSLDILKETFGKIIITKEVEREITSGDFPEIGDIRRGIGKGCCRGRGNTIHRDNWTYHFCTGKS